jgi:hypothetical protein
MDMVRPDVKKQNPLLSGVSGSVRRARLLLSLGLLWSAGALAAADATSYFEIQVVDAQTGRGVPLVELRTVNQVRYYTDSHGRAAFHEPGLMSQPIHFAVRSHGYEFPKDGFGNAGVVLNTQPGRRAQIKIQRKNVAERLYRITGQGIYRDSVLLGKPAPLAEPLGSGKVAGQDSAFALLYRNRIYWFWGDTSRMSYPLGHFWMAGAVSDPPGKGGLDPAVGVNLRYVTNRDGFSRPVARLGVERGMIWADTFATVSEDGGRERLVCRYAHMESLAKMTGHGLAIYNDEREEFERLLELDLKYRNRFPAQSHPIRIAHEDGDYLYFGDVFPTVRVPAQLSSFTELDRYEYFTCLADGSNPDELKVDRDSDGHPRYQWRRNIDPIDVSTEQKLIESGKINADHARFSPRDADSGKRLRMHRGSVRWNEHRKCWVLIAGELGGSSLLGEIWYAEAPEPTGPWKRAKKVVTHDQYSFYNPVHHDFFDQGNYIYFEGTYTMTFSGNPDPTPWYEYNQIMYRLDLDDPRLEACRNSR